MSADTRKLIFVIFYVSCMMTLMITGKVPTEVGVPAITAMGGYVVGNGYNSLQGRISTPVLVPKDTQTTNDTKTKDEGASNG